jgi:hypothetical protein
MRCSALALALALRSRFCLSTCYSTSLICLVALQGCHAIVADAEVREVCQRMAPQRIAVPVLPGLPNLPGLPAGPGDAPRTVSLSQDFAFDLALDLPRGEPIDTRVLLSHITLSAAEGAGDLGFIDTASLEMKAPAESPLAPLRFDFTRSELTPKGFTVTRPGLELGRYLSAGALTYTLSMVGTLPEHDVELSIETCASAEIHLSL